MRMLAHRIADPRVLRLIERWLGAGVLESGQWKAVEAGTPQGSGISPILANVFLHYVVDLWVHQWRRRRAAGQVIVCRYADDMVLGCQYEADGKQLLADLKEQAGAVRPVAPRGQDPADRVRAVRRPQPSRRWAATPGDVRLSGLHALLRQDQDERFTVKRKTQAKRLVRKLKAIRDEMQRRMHAPVREQHRWLRQVLNGHYQYFGVIFNYRSLRVFKECVVRYWRKTLGKRSQKGRMNWATYRQLLTAFPLPEPAIHQAWLQ